MIKEVINRYQKRVKTSAEILFFKKHRYLLKNYYFWDMYYTATERFEIIKANIIIKALLNKSKIEEIYQNALIENQKLNSQMLLIKLQKEIDELISFPVMHQKIFVPIFDRANNLVFYNNILNLGAYPYNHLINDFQTLRIHPFDYYGIALFDSEFTSLIKIDGDTTSACFYHYQFQTLFFVNNQGYLDFEIKLFDRYLNVFDYHDLLPRLRKVAAAYYANNRDLMLKELINAGFVSHQVSHQVAKRLAGFYKKRNKVLGKGVSDVEI